MPDTEGMRVKNSHVVTYTLRKCQSTRVNEQFNSLHSNLSLHFLIMFFFPVHLLTRAKDHMGNASPDWLKLPPQAISTAVNQEDPMWLTSRQHWASFTAQLHLSTNVCPRFSLILTWKHFHDFGDGLCLPHVGLLEINPFPVSPPPISLPLDFVSSVFGTPPARCSCTPMPQTQEKQQHCPGDTEWGK